MNLQIDALLQFIVTIGLLTAVTILTKSVAIYSLARKVMPKRVRTVSILLNAPMIVGVVIASLGLREGLINEQLYSIILGSVVASSLIAVVFGRYPEDEEKETPASESTQATQPQYGRTSSLAK